MNIRGNFLIKNEGEDMDIQIEDFKDVIELFEKDCGEPVESYISFNRLFVYGNGNELMLRINKHTSSLVIARVLFVNQRVGYGTLLLERLEKVARKYGLSKMYVESVLTEEMINFLKKHGFENVESGFRVDGIYYSDWVRNIS